MNIFHYEKTRILKRFCYFIGVILAAFFSFSCEAPRSNPLDPLNPQNDLGTINGVVKTSSLPFTGIADVSVYMPSADVLVKTDQGGNFTISNVPAVSGVLIFQKAGYRVDTLNVEWNSAREFEPVVNLNSIPVLGSLYVFTSVINQPNSNQSYGLNVQAKVTDKDNNIDSVLVSNSKLGVTRKLTYNSFQNDYEISITPAELNISNLEQTIGLDFNIAAYDKFKNSYQLGSGKVVRVINSQLNIVSPANSAHVTSTPTLTWQKFTATYPFTYTVEVYSNGVANQNKIISQTGISSDATSYTITNALASQNYYWVVLVVDSFKNNERSEPATFTVN